MEIDADLMEIFLEEMRGRIDLLYQYRRDDQVEELKDLIHRIKGTGGSFGYQEVTEIALRIESNMDEGDWTAVDTELNNLSSWFHRTVPGQG